MFEEFKFAVSYVIFYFGSVCVPCFCELMHNNSSQLKVYGISETMNHIKD